jgi:hypothetical protein
MYGFKKKVVIYSEALADGSGILFLVFFSQEDKANKEITPCYSTQDL